MDDAALVDRLNRGDTSAFDALYERYRDWVYGLAWREARDEQIAMDTVQDVFVYLLSKFPGFELRAKMTTFLYPAVRHTAQSLAKKRRRATPGIGRGDGAEEGVDGLLATIAGAAGGDAGADAELRVALVRAIEGLSDAHRDVLLMRFVDGMGVSEVAEAVGVPGGTVKSRLYHAVRQVREDPGLRRWMGVRGGSEDRES